MYSYQEWSPTSINTSTFIDKKLKEQESVCFSKVEYFNVNTIKMVYSAILNFLFDTMLYTKMILTDFEGSNFSFPLHYQV